MAKWWSMGACLWAGISIGLACKDGKGPIVPGADVKFGGSADVSGLGQQLPISIEFSEGTLGSNPGEGSANESSENVPSDPPGPPNGSDPNAGPPAPTPSPPPPSAPFYPASCEALKKAKPETPSGVHKIYLNPQASNPVALDAYCDMTTDGGGWTLVLNYVHRGSTNPPLAIRNQDLPLLGGDSLGTDESANAAVWGHASPTFLASFAPRELRFYCRSSQNARVLHFKTNEASCLTAATTGTGSCRNVRNAFTALGGHTATIPAAADSGAENSGSEALTRDVFGRDQEGADTMWSIRGSGGDDAWECDFGSNNANADTIHRVFFR